MSLIREAWLEYRRTHRPDPGDTLEYFINEIEKELSNNIRAGVFTAYVPIPQLHLGNLTTEIKSALGNRFKQHGVIVGLSTDSACLVAKLNVEEPII